MGKGFWGNEAARSSSALHSWHCKTPDPATKLSHSCPWMGFASWGSDLLWGPHNHPSALIPQAPLSHLPWAQKSVFLQLQGTHRAVEGCLEAWVDQDCRLPRAAAGAFTLSRLICYASEMLSAFETELLIMTKENVRHLFKVSFAY